jgi:4-aminobutyrate aminotransferase
MKIKIDSKTKRIIARDQKVMLTTTREHYPFVADHGDGDYIYDVSGNKFIDFSSFISVYNLGVNANKEIREAIKKQADKLIHPAFTDFYSEKPVSFAEKLVKMFPKGFGRVFFSNSGTEANEDAIKLSRIFTKRQYIISFYNSFHGRTLGSLGLTSSRTIQKKHMGPFPNIVHSLYPYPYRCPFKSSTPEECSSAAIDYLESYLLGKEVPPEEVAAIFFEPIQGEGGYIVPPKDFFKELKKVADKHGILLVADEIQTGYMRTGKFLALDHFRVSADIYTMAKSLGGGVPIGATISKLSLGNVEKGEHANTFGGNLLAIAAADASIDYISKNKRSLELNVERKGKHMISRLLEMQDRYEIIGDVRGIGLMIAIELVKSKKGKEPAGEERSRILEDAFYSGLVLLPAGLSSIRIIPPLTVSDGALNEGLNILENSIKKESMRKLR